MIARMPKIWFIGWVVLTLNISCDSKRNKENRSQVQQTQKQVTAEDILGKSDYLAISYGGYRTDTRTVQPTIEELKEDMKILQAMNIKILRTYNVQLAQASNLMKAIRELKEEDNEFEMYVMLGAWIDCLNAWTDIAPDHYAESEQNKGEIERAVALAKQYPDIIKIIAVGNEAMVKWAESYYVQPNIILKWVNYLQALKKAEHLPKDIWITSSDNFASWGGGAVEYHTDDLNKLIKAVDYISLHTYPMHDTHYNPQFWGVLESEKDLQKEEKIAVAIERSLEYAKAQYNAVADYVKNLNIEKPIHIGETGWASKSNGLYGNNGSKATDELKQALYYKSMRTWTNDQGIACFYFEAFDEIWKDGANPDGSENHFGLFKVNGKAKYAVWDLVDENAFEGLTRNGNYITKTFDGDKNDLLKTVELPIVKSKVLVSF